MKRLLTSLLIFFFVVVSALTTSSHDVISPWPNNVPNSYGLKTYSAPSTLQVFGDSITFGTGATTLYPNLISNNTTWALSNQAVTGTEITDFVFRVLNNGTIPATGNQYAVLTGYNDMRQFGTDATRQTTLYQPALRALAVWLATPNSVIKQGNDASWTKTGSWTNSLLYNNLITTYSTTNGNTAQITVSGTTVYLGYISRYGFGDGSTFTVSIDGVAKGTIDGNAGGEQPSGGQSYSAYVARFAGLSEGAHVVLITHTGAGGKFTQIGWISTNYGFDQNTAPAVYLGNTLYMNTTGYTLAAPFNVGSTAAVDQYNIINKQMAADLASDGLNVIYVDANGDYNLTTDAGGDNIHPNNTGHQHIANAFLSAINGIVTPAMRQNANSKSVKNLSATAVLDFGNLAAIGCEDLTIALTGAVLGDSVAIGVPNGSVVNSTATFTGWISATDTCTIRYCNLVSGDPASGTFRCDAWQH